MSWSLRKNKTDLFNSLLIALFIAVLFFIFYLKWIHLEFDVGREFYQAFVISTQSKSLYTEVTHFFGPLTPLANASFLTIFGATIFNFSLIGLFISILSALFLYEISRSVLDSAHSLLSVLLFSSFAVINLGGASLFMPYSYSHSYGILITFISLTLLIKNREKYSLNTHLGFILSTSLLAFTKQEYLIVLLTLQVIFIINIFLYYKSRIWQIILLHGVLQSVLIIILYKFLFNNYSLVALLHESQSMFLEHNKSIIFNFLMLYSPSTLKLSLISIIPFLIIISYVLIKKNKTLWGSLMASIILLLSYFFRETLVNELLNRGFLLNWITLSLFGFLVYHIFKKKQKIDAIFMLTLVSISLFNRQQSSAWMWQGLNWIVFIYLIQKLSKHYHLKQFTKVVAVTLILVSMVSIPHKLNQGWDTINVKNKYSEVIPVKKEWALPIQQAVNYLESLPARTTLYTGQESAWLNVFVKKYNQVRNQQWWGYLEKNTTKDILTSKPQIITIVQYTDKQARFRLYGKADLIWDKVKHLYEHKTTYQNEAIRISIYKLKNQIELE